MFDEVLKWIRRVEIIARALTALVCLLAFLWKVVKHELGF